MKEKYTSWQITGKRKTLATELNNKWNEKVEHMQKATPIHPESGKVGYFVDFVPGGNGLRPLYQTEEGKQFFVPVVFRSQKLSKEG